MTSSQTYSKDRSVATATPLFFAQTDASRASCPACPACATPLFAGGAAYCSEACQRRDRVDHGHWMLCGKAAAQFLAHARTTNDLFAAAARVVAALSSKAVVKASSSSSSSCVEQLQVQLAQFGVDFPADAPAWWGADGNGDGDGDGDGDDGDVAATLRDQAHERWTLLQLLLRHDAAHARVTHHPTLDVVAVAASEAGLDTLPIGTAAADLLTWAHYGRLVGAVDAHLAPLLLEVHSPLDIHSPQSHL